MVANSEARQKRASRTLQCKQQSLTPASFNPITVSSDLKTLCDGNSVRQKQVLASRFPLRNSSHR
jgi:hypothetical protein